MTPGLASSWLNHKALLSPVEIIMLVAPGKDAEHRMEREFPILSVKLILFRMSADCPVSAGLPLF